MKISAMSGVFSFCALVFTAGTVVVCTPAHAQTPPDAGSVLRQIEKQQQKPLPPKSDPQFVPPPPLRSLGGATVTVTAFRFAGNTLLTNDEIAPAVTGFIGHPLDFTELQNAAIAVANAYREAGWVVRAYLPEQDVTGGTITIQIVEARLGAIGVEGPVTRISASRVQRFVESVQAPGAALNASALDRGLLLINDLPGVSASGRLREGLHQAETDLVLTVQDDPLVDGNLIVDNVGSRFTGAARIIAAASLNGRFGLGDQADVLLLHSKGSDYARVAYSLAVGSRGWRVGANASRLNYDIVTRDFAALDVHGDSTTMGVEASYPLLRSRLKNLYFGFNGQNRAFDNESAGETTTDYSVRTVSVGLYGNMYDRFYGGGATSASIEMVQGDVDLGGSPNQSVDALTTRTAGSFNKFRFSASRLQVLTNRVSLYAGISGQLASKNLDSSEKLYLGGSTGVRAYPQDEGGGSEGVLLTLEARTQLPGNFSLTGFLDGGSVRINKDNDILGAVADNTNTFKGAGLSVGWTAGFGLNIRATLAHRLGDNPNPTSAGDDQDGSLVKNRFWVQASMSF